ncbi:MAG: hypothetical protein R3Y54_11260 [Eubacteriales bacterium]
MDRKENHLHSSKGNQFKWMEGNIWYKIDGLGYESLAEIMVSRLLEKSNVEKVVIYDYIQYERNQIMENGCVSKHFLQENEELITVERLVLQTTGQSMATLLVGKSVKEKIRLLVDMVEDVTGITDFGAYITLLLEIDAFFLNEDRHTHNIAVIRKK